jgi:hypothetical protein
MATFKELRIYVNPKPESMKDEIEDFLVRELLERGYDVASDGSCEGGIQFNMTSEWREILNKDPYASKLIQYHYCRRLRFEVENGYIVAMRSKDCMPYFTAEELRVVQETFNSL